MSDTIELMMRDIDAMRRQLEAFTSGGYATVQFVPLTTPLTSTSWDGDAFSTTAKTKIDLSAVFGAPAGIKAIAVRLVCRDSGSSGTSSATVRISATDTADEGAVVTRCGGLPNDYYADNSGVCPCNADGDIYYQTQASGSGTLDVIMQIWGYWI